MKRLTTVLALASFALLFACSDEPPPPRIGSSRPAAPAPTSSIGLFSDAGPPDAASLPCNKTLCDLKADNCVDPVEPDPCGVCRRFCLSHSPEVASCLSSCAALCAPKGPLVGHCQQKLAACRRTAENKVCTDGIAQATEEQPCGEVASRVSCAAKDDMEAQRAIYAANPQCKACDQQWTRRCIDQTCRLEAQRLAACIAGADCEDGGLCEQCDAERDAHARCVWKRMDDPNDVGGCNSGAHRCWTKPICNDDGSAR